MCRASLYFPGLMGLILWGALPAAAGTVILSGDSNIADFIGVSGDDNGVFFQNVLGAGTNVLIQELDPGTAAEGGEIATFYNTLGGVTANQTTTSSITNLSGVNLFISMLPQTAYSSGEISAMSSFLAGGGTLFLIGEGQGYAPGGVSLPFLNSALSSLGSPLSFVPASHDPGTHTASGGRIATNALTAGVNNFGYAYTSETIGGTPLFFDSTDAAFVEVSGSATPEPGTLPVVVLGLTAILITHRHQLQKRQKIARGFAGRRFSN
jgi:hypothetical protein